MSKISHEMKVEGMEESLGLGLRDRWDSFWIWARLLLAWRGDPKWVLQFYMLRVLFESGLQVYRYWVMTLPASIRLSDKGKVPLIVSREAI